MAVISKKDKLIEDAQKFTLRGQFDKAVAIYEQITAAEPAAYNLRQKLAELLIKSGRNDAARKELETIGSHYSGGGFFLKAIAVYKQIQKLFPADISIPLKLAELNEKHGLVANALSEYKLVHEHYDKGGEDYEALKILDKMQQLDPQNIPVKMKLAEGYYQHDKKAESFAIFTKIISLLLDRNDRALLGKMCSHIQQLFPDKPDFMLEMLSIQINQGNAATAIDSLQRLLRSNPNNKTLWDLIVLAYRKLEQPQKVKLAFHHYLTFFPAEPTAMLGLISATTDEKNVAEAIDLLDRLEGGLITGGFLQELDTIYHALDKADPINIRILQGLIRIATARGNENDVLTLTSKLRSLQSVAAGGQLNDAVEPESFPEDTAADNDDLPEDEAIDLDVIPEVDDVELEAIPETFDVQMAEFHTPDETPFGEISIFELPDVSNAEAFEIEHSPEFELETRSFYSDAPGDENDGSDEEIELDLDIDFDSPFGLSDSEPDSAAFPDFDQDSLNDLFDAIDTAPRTVKFGNEMDDSDAQSHFDLGQAFKEMGLYDEAINEFRQASLDPLRRVECLILQCACLRERGELEKAISMLQALLKPGLREEESCAVKYELAAGYESAGRNDESNILLNEIYAINPDFRDINSRLNVSGSSESLDFSDDDLKDF